MNPRDGIVTQRRLQHRYSLSAPAVSNVIGSQGFSNAAPLIWNQLPFEIRSEA